jgi:predicted nucleic acid-binding protein
VARSRRQSEAQAPQRLILDSGAVIALARNDPRARSVLRAAHEAGVELLIPSVVLAETVRGEARDAPVNVVIKAVGEVIPATEAIGRLAGGLLGTSGSSETIDALVVASALAVGGGAILTGDEDDLALLAAGHPEVVVTGL